MGVVTVQSTIGGDVHMSFSDEYDVQQENVDKAVEVAQNMRSSTGDNWSPPTPPSDAIVWRYLNFTQLLSILERDKLWFTNVNQFEDPYEGTVPMPNLNNEIEKIVEESDVPKKVASIIHDRIFRSGGSYVSGGYVSCWNINDHQSAALWEQYIDSMEGIAIRTSVENLATALEDAERDFTFGKVKYIDYETEEIPGGEIPAIYHKRNSFEHEREYRMSFLSDSEENLGSGSYIPIDKDRLLEDLIISPLAPNWFKELVDNVLDTYSVQCNLKESRLYSKPD